jgi:hypothetical protein
VGVVLVMIKAPFPAAMPNANRVTPPMSERPCGIATRDKTAVISATIPEDDG